MGKEGQGRAENTEGYVSGGRYREDSKNLNHVLCSCNRTKGGCAFRADLHASPVKTTEEGCHQVLHDSMTLQRQHDQKGRIEGQVGEEVVFYFISAGC